MKLITVSGYRNNSVGILISIWSAVKADIFVLYSLLSASIGLSFAARLAGI